MSRISYRNYPVLKNLRAKNFDGLKFLAEDIQILEDNYDALKHAFNENTQLFTKNVTYRTEPFYAACNKAGMAYTASAKLMLKSLRGQELTGVILSPRGTLLYMVGVSIEGGDKILLYVFL